MKRIQLSLAACRVLVPYRQSILDDAQYNLAKKIMDKQMKKKLAGTKDE